MKIRSVLGFVVPSLKENIKCQSCGEGFVCGATLAGCWCAEIKLDDETRSELRARYDDCLCRTCLEKHAAMRGMIITYPDGSRETLANAVRVDTQNFHEGMYDFYDAEGRLLRQIDMGSRISWESFDVTS